MLICFSRLSIRSRGFLCAGIQERRHQGSEENAYKSAYSDRLYLDLPVLGFYPCSVRTGNWVDGSLIALALAESITDLMRKSLWLGMILVFSSVAQGAQIGNDDPTAVDDGATTDEDTAVIIDVLANDSDSDGDTLSVDSVSVPTNGLAVINGDQTVTYTPDADFNGSDSFTYTISDGQGGTATATVDVTVNAINDDPTAVDDEATTDEDTAVIIDVLANDSDRDGDTLSVVDATTTPGTLVVINADQTITYTPDPDHPEPEVGDR